MLAETSVYSFQHDATIEFSVTQKLVLYFQAIAPLCTPSGQFIGARGEFFLECCVQVFCFVVLCKELAKLQDSVPPMPPADVEHILKTELQASRLDEIFEWIDMDTPLGSASIAQLPLSLHVSAIFSKLVRVTYNNPQPELCQTQHSI